MRILLDTHVLYWFIEGSPRLTQTALSTISDGDNEILVSPACYWEIAVKLSLGKWQLDRPYLDFIAIAINHYGFQTLPISPAHTASLIELPFHHKDPFDRLLVAQALTETIPIASADAQLDAYGVARIW